MDWARSQESGWGLRQCAGVRFFSTFLRCTLNPRPRRTEGKRGKLLFAVDNDRS